jgi:hypothetical protein
MDNATTAGPPVLRVEEADYQYGAGPLTLRLEAIDWSNPVRYDNDVWYPVRGVQIAWNGAELDRREVLVRARRLPPHRAPNR